jgi:hypothetical protein
VLLISVSHEEEEEQQPMVWDVDRHFFWQCPWCSEGCSVATAVSSPIHEEEESEAAL